jgi:hypothetical protein
LSLPPIQGVIVLHFAAKRTALCGKTRCIMPQNGSCFAAKWGYDLPQNGGAFCGKMIHFFKTLRLSPAPM